jgi:hypothetical protein
MSMKKNYGWKDELTEMEPKTHVRERPPPVPFRKFLHNSEEGTFLGRTPSSWGKRNRELLVIFFRG